MLPDATFDHIVTGFYKAAGGETPWNVALELFQQAFDAWAIYVHSLNTKLGRIEFAYIASSVPAEAEIDYLQTYHRIEPRVNVLALNAMPGQWFNCWETFDDDFVARDPFYQNYLIPYGGRYVSGTVLARDDERLVMLGVHRGIRSEKLDRDEIETCRRLARHLGEAIRLHRATVKLRSQVRIGMQLLSRLQLPIVVVDAQRRIEQANLAGRDALGRHRTLFQDGDRFYLRSPRDDARFVLELRRLLDSTIAGDAEKFLLNIGSADDARPIALHVSALRPADTLHAFADDPLALIAICEPSGRVELDPYLVQMLFGLTPAESRVAIAVAHGDTPKEIALRHGVSNHTVRTQMKSVFAKAGVSRQAELVTRLMTLPSLRD